MDDRAVARETGWLSGAVVSGFFGTMLAAIVLFCGYALASALASAPNAGLPLMPCGLVDSCLVKRTAL